MVRLDDRQPTQRETEYTDETLPQSDASCAALVQIDSCFRVDRGRRIRQAADVPGSLGRWRFFAREPATPMRVGAALDATALVPSVAGRTRTRAPVT